VHRDAFGSGYGLDQLVGLLAVAAAAAQYLDVHLE
jgi:hypothetical protein